MAKVLDGYKLGKKIIEGKTKVVYELVDEPENCLLENKDRITAGDGVKAHDLEGKAEISNSTNGKVFQILNNAGIKTAYVKKSGPKTFISRKCEMIPIEWVTRRLATGSFLKRREGVPEGYRFCPPLQETFFKDDANHDPQWSEEQIVSASFKVSGKIIGQDEVDMMRRTTIVVFEVLERSWATRDCALIDMKIEFGVDTRGNLLVADVIDSDSWRLWPSGDKRLMKDKQVYRNLTNVTQEDLDTVKRNFKWIDDQLAQLLTYQSTALAVIFMGSPSDEAHCRAISTNCEKLGLKSVLRVSSAHKATASTMKILAEYEGSGRPIVLIGVAGRSNGLGPVLSGNSSFPVINCPPVTADNVQQDIWSSVNVPSCLGCTTVRYPEAAALAAAQIVGLSDHTVWSRLRVQQVNTHNGLTISDQAVRAK